MARPTEFDRDNALQQAMILFWRQGYSATSMSQLLDTMAISRSSFYAAYGDKRALFIEALDLFAQRTLDILKRNADPARPYDSIQGFFDDTTFRVSGWRRNSGCMMVNSILELADVDDELCQRAVDRLADIEAGFAELLQGHCEEPSERAALVMTLNQGVRVACRAGAPEEQLSSTISTTLGLLRQAA